MSTLKKFAGQTAIYGLTTIAARLLNFFLTPIYVHVYAPSVYGVFSELYSFTSLISAIITFGMETTYFRFLNKEKNNPCVFNNAFFTVFIMSGLFLVLGYLGLEHINVFLQKGVSKATADYRIFIQLFFWIIFIDNLSALPYARLRAEGRPLRYAVVRCINISFFILLNLFFIYLFPRLKNPPDTAHWVGYVFVSNLLASALTFLLLLPETGKFRFRLDGSLLKAMFAYSWPVLMANISFTINENLDKIYLKNLLPEGQRLVQLGIYSGCYKLAVFLNLFIQAFRLGAEPFFFSQVSDPGAPKTYARIMNYFVIMVAVIFLAIVANIGWLKYFINNPRYWAGLNVVPILLLGYVCLGIYMNLSVWYKLSDKTRYGFYISGIGALITVVLNPLLIPVMGYMGSAWTTLAAYFVMMVSSFVWGQKNFPIPYQTGKAIGILLTAIALGFLSFVIFHQRFLLGNALLIGFILLIFVLERNELKKIFSKPIRHAN